MIEGCERPSSFTGTFFSNGQSITVCDEDFVIFAAGTLEAMTGVPVGDIIALAQSGELEVPEAPTDGTGEPGPTSPELSEAGTASDLDEELAPDPPLLLDDATIDAAIQAEIDSLDTN